MNVYVRSRSKWNLEVLVFEERGKPEYPEKNFSEQRERTNNKLNPHMASTPGFEPRPHWWEASALTTAPPLPPTLPFLVVVKVGRFSTTSALCPCGGLKFVLVAVLDVLKASI